MPAATTPPVERAEPPMALLAELTHRCPLACPYCSNPLELTRASAELETADWLRIFREAAALGAMQVHLSGGEPLARADIVDLVAGAHEAGLYTNLITAAVTLSPGRLDALASAGLDHVQISLQDADAAGADRIAGLAGAHARKLRAAEMVRSRGLALTLNVVVHRHNLDRIEELIELGVASGAGRMEIAHAQYHGWGLANRAALLPRADQVRRAVSVVGAAAARLRGRMAIDHVLPDHFAARPKACMGGWARRFFVVSPQGRAMPCHAADTIPGLAFPDLRRTPVAEAWQEAEAFRRFRGTGWMPEPCRGCERREVDWGGCRCQALALTGDAAATDPACALSPQHHRMAEAVGDATVDAFRPRRF
ncbi:coenzyme PQQ synthesis protein E [Allostella sp. ATCC 35155]|nr:coenzyme PQQ synthesis protein E [Stella sp. ATCC 35155]